MQDIVRNNPEGERKQKCTYITDGKSCFFFYIYRYNPYVLCFISFIVFCIVVSNECKNLKTVPIQP